MRQLSVGIELHKLRLLNFHRLILEILAIPASSGAVERLFSQFTIRCANKRNRMSTKNLEFLVQIAFIISILKFKLSKFHLPEKNRRIYMKTLDF